MLKWGTGYRQKTTVLMVNWFSINLYVNFLKKKRKENVNHLLCSIVARIIVERVLLKVEIECVLLLFLLILVQINLVRNDD